MGTSLELKRNCVTPHRGEKSKRKIRVSVVVTGLSGLAVRSFLHTGVSLLRNEFSACFGVVSLKVV